jgi:hypothetical protein
MRDEKDRQDIEIMLRFWEEDGMISPRWWVVPDKDDGWTAIFFMHRMCDYALSAEEFDVFARGVVEGKVWQQSRRGYLGDPPPEITWLECVSLLGVPDGGVRLRGLEGLRRIVQNHPDRIPGTRAVLVAILDAWPEGELHRAAAGLLEDL